MEQEIRFLRYAGRKVAYATVGEGPPLVLACWWIGHLEREWDVPAFRDFVRGLADVRTVVRYDRPGCGLSDPSPPFADELDGETRLLEAVVEALGGGPVALFGASCGGCGAIALSAERPELVERLVLYGAYLRGSEITTPEVAESLQALVHAHWGLGSQTLADVFMPDADAAERDAFAGFQRRTSSPERAADRLRLVYELDASAHAPHVAAPTLVLHRRGDRAIPVELGRDVAARIADARFIPLAGRNHFPWHGDTDAVLRPLRAFLGAPAAPGDALDGSPLSSREREVLVLIARGLSDSEIAGQLVLSPHTIHRHVANMRRKLRQPSRAAAVAEAARRGLI